MAIIHVSEFFERVETQIVICPTCNGLMQPISAHRLDALKFVLGKKTIPKRYQCLDCCLIKKIVV